MISIPKERKKACRHHWLTGTALTASPKGFSDTTSAFPGSGFISI
jgi:hypothetical protein